MKHLLALFAAVFFGGVVAAMVASVAYPHPSEYSYVSPTIIFPILSVWVSLPAYVIAMVVTGLRTKETRKETRMALSVAASAIATLIGSIALVATIKLKEIDRRTIAQRQWAEAQELQRRNPHALVNDTALPEDEDSGYRIRYVDDKGVVRTNPESANVTRYVVLPPGKHKIVLHGDTPKAERLKREWFLQGSVEVQAGRLYQLRVTDGHISLLDVTRSPMPPPKS